VLTVNLCRLQCLHEYSGLGEVLVRILGQEMTVASAVNSSRLYADPATDSVRYEGDMSARLFVHMFNVPVLSVMSCGLRQLAPCGLQAILAGCDKRAKDTVVVMYIWFADLDLLLTHSFVSVEVKLSFVEPGRRWARSPSPSKAPGISYQGTMKTSMRMLKTSRGF